MTGMPERNSNEETSAAVEIVVTRCPECGTEWETVVTRRRDLARTTLPVQA